MQNYYTENLSEFGQRERKIAAKLLSAPLPEGFCDCWIKLAFNKSSCFVFLVNDDFQVAMLDGDNLEIFHSTPYEGREGFLSELLDDSPDDYHHEDAEYIRDCAKNEGVDLPENWKE